jgi:nucleotide-binding universal stress UspA family protein
VTVIEYAAIPSEVWRKAAGQIEPVRQAMLGRAEEVTGRMVERLKEVGITAEAVIKIDDPRFVITREAEDWPADLIFIRSHTHRDITRWLLGSVASAVLHDAPCSVEIVRTTANEAARFFQSGMRILLATDGSEHSRLAAHSVSQRPWPAGTEVKIISVINPFVRLIEVELSSPEESVKGPETPREAVEEAEQIIGSAGLKMTGETITGYPKTEIINRAKEWGADLIVVGSHGRRGLKRLLIGSISEAVATHAPCSVEVIKAVTSDR